MLIINLNRKWEFEKFEAVLRYIFPFRDTVSKELKRKFKINSYRSISLCKRIFLFLPVFRLNTWKCGPKKNKLRTHFTQCKTKTKLSVFVGINTGKISATMCSFQPFLGQWRAIVKSTPTQLLVHPWQLLG